MLKLKNVYGGYGEQFILHNINLEVNKGEFFGIIGPNGSGKTTLVKMISGIIQTGKGTIHLEDKQIQSYHPKQLARKLAVLPQLTEQSFRFTVRETVSLGRYAYQTGLFQTLHAQDEQIIDQVLEQTDMKRYEHKPIDQLSGGERQRVFLAQALAQEPEVIILDEPTNHLDLAYQKELLDLLKQWTYERQLTVISIFHDLNLASLYCDRLLLLNKGKISICAEPNEVLNNEQILEVYGTEIENRSHPLIPKPQVMLIPKKISNGLKWEVTEEHFFQNKDFVSVSTPSRLKTISTCNFAGGIGWYNRFIHQDNLSNDDQTTNPQQKNCFTTENNAHSSDTIIISSIGQFRNVTKKILYGDGFSIFIVVTTSSNEDRGLSPKQGNSPKINYLDSINIWIFVNGKLTDAAFIQAIVSATEAKLKVLYEANFGCKSNNLLMNKQETDGILIASTQEGKALHSANMTSPLGSLIVEGIYHCLKKHYSDNVRV